MVFGTYVELSKKSPSSQVRRGYGLLNPFYPSPQRDNGYDISGYYMAVDPLLVI